MLAQKAPPETQRQVLGQKRQKQETEVREGTGEGTGIAANRSLLRRRCFQKPPSVESRRSLAAVGRGAETKTRGLPVIVVDNGALSHFRSVAAREAEGRHWLRTVTLPVRQA
jgi:hypothetical protein